MVVSVMYGYVHVSFQDQVHPAGGWASWHCLCYYCGFICALLAKPIGETDEASLRFSVLRSAVPSWYEKKT